MFPKLISFGDFFLPTYGFFVTLGFLAAMWLALKLARRESLDPELISNLVVYCALAGLAGAKLLMFAMDFDYYATHPGALFSVSTLLSAGVYYGGFLGALAFAWFYIRKNGLPWLKTADVFAPAVALGHAVGRIGCFAAGCCWGARCDRPWAVTFTDTDAAKITGVPLGIPLHPTQLYEAGATFAIAAVLYWASLKKHAPGHILGLYLVLYSAVRLWLEFYREHDQALPFGGPLTYTQWIAAVLVVAGFALLGNSRRRA
jgi:phosphatidylglycerol:prolipoprotein diacylglycerol transferase